MHHPCWHLQIVAHADRGPLPADPRQQGLQRQRFRLEMQLQRADPRRDIDDPFPGLPFKGLHQGMDAKAQHQIQLRLTGLQQQMGITGEARHQAFVGVTAGHHHRRGERHRLPGNVLRLQGRQLRATACRQPPGGGYVHRHKAHFIPRLKLAQLPEIGFDHRHRADEAPEAWAVRPEDHRHIAGKIHGPHGIGVVMNIRGMQPGFAAAVTGPDRLRPDQAHAGAAGVKMHFPVGGKKGRHIRRGKELRRAVGTINHPQRTDVRQRGAQPCGKRRAFPCLNQRRKMQHVASA